MKFSQVARESKDQLVLSGEGTMRRFLNGNPHRLALVERDGCAFYVIGSDVSRPEVVAVRAADSDSRAILDALRERSDTEAVDRLLAQLEQEAPDDFAEDAVGGLLTFVDPVLTVIAGDRRWDFVPDREPAPIVRSVEPSEDDSISVRLRMPDDERIRLIVGSDFSDCAYRALAVLRASNVEKDPDERVRWQYGVVNIGMFKALNRMTSVFASLGADGWEMVAIYDKSSNWLAGMEKGFMLFKRPVPAGVELQPSEWCRSINVAGGA